MQKQNVLKEYVSIAMAGHYAKPALNVHQI